MLVGPSISTVISENVWYISLQPFLLTQRIMIENAMIVPCSAPVISYSYFTLTNDIKASYRAQRLASTFRSELSGPLSPCLTNDKTSHKHWPASQCSKVFQNKTKTQIKRFLSKIFIFFRLSPVPLRITSSKYKTKYWQGQIITLKGFKISFEDRPNSLPDSGPPESPDIRKPKTKTYRLYHKMADVRHL